MCRWLAYSGSPIALETFVLQPEHSLIDQSLHARMGHGAAALSAAEVTSR